MNFPHGVMATIRKVTTTRDEYGDAETDETTRRWGPIARAPRYATENNDPRAVPVVIGETFYGPAATFDSDDLIVVGAETFQVDGLPVTWRNPFTGWAPGIEVPVKRTAAV